MSDEPSLGLVRIILLRAFEMRGGRLCELFVVAAFK